ncbi:sensor histidine kinase [Nonlabens sp. Asnod2-A12]|uniref:sensor histidine kinase n=1 Tax=Nonlabens sp. Asnod2-A12 TaxID=3160578 RepID=UPI003869205E
MIRIWIFLAFLCAINMCTGQSCINYSEKDGLPSNHVYKITQDIHGFIWIATDEGLVKYNGTEFKTFTTKDGLPTNDIWNLFPGADGKLWYIAKSTSLGYILDDVIYDYSNEQEEIILDPIFAGFTGNKVILSDSHLSHTLNDQLLWQLKYYNPKERYQNFAYLLNDTYQGLAIEKLVHKGKMAVITKDHEYISIDNSALNSDSYSRSQITDSLFVTNSFHSYAFLNLNNLMAKEYTYQEQLGIPSLKYGRIHLVNGKLQLTGENVVAILDQKLKPEKVIPIPAAWRSHFSFIDKENTIWVATFTDGIYKYSLNEQRVATQLEPYKINDITQVNDDIIALVNGKGFYKYNDSLNLFKPYIDSDKFLYKSKYIKDYNTAYYITKNNIFTLKNGVLKDTVFPDVNETARSVSMYDGSLYGHYTTGLKKIDPASLKVLKVYYLKGIRNEVTFKDNIIVAASNGLYHLKSDELTRIEALSDFKKPVTDLITIEKEKLLITTSGYGVYWTDLNSIYLLKGSEYLKSNNPFYQDNQLYLPTNKGVYNYEYKDGKFSLQHIWDNTNGLPTNKINGIHRIDNQLLVATNKGIINLPIDFKTHQRLLDLYVETASYNKNNLKISNHVDYNSNSDLQLVIKSIDYRNNQKPAYQYRLMPAQTDWVMSSSSNLSFTDLTPGDYKLELRIDQVTNSFDFVVEPRWYQTWWFYVIAFLLFILLVIIITKTITKKSEKKKTKNLFQAKKLSELQLKALRSQMNPHFVFNSLTAIQYYINENDFETSDTYLVKFSRLIREFFEMSKEHLVSVDREIKLLNNYLSLEQLRFKGKLNYIFEIDPELDLTDKLPSMLLQPIVENAVNHGIFNKETAGTVLIKFTRIDSNEIEICIVDNGKGYKATQEDGRYKSTSVLDDRLKYLRETGDWEITVKREDAFSHKKDKGHQVLFHLKKLNNENI